MDPLIDYTDHWIGLVRENWTKALKVRAPTLVDTE